MIFDFFGLFFVQQKFKICTATAVQKPLKNTLLGVRIGLLRVPGGMTPLWADFTRVDQLYQFSAPEDW